MFVKRLVITGNRVFAKGRDRAASCRVGGGAKEECVIENCFLARGTCLWISIQLL